MRDVILGAYVHLAMIAVAAGGGERSVAYDQAAGQWLFDPAAIVSRNDVLYATPSAAAWEAMPVGGGDFSAMVYCDGAGLDLHLTKSDAWGFQQPADAPLGKRFFNNVSPGHVRLEFGPRGRELAAARFRQRLDLYRGRVVVELGPEEHEVRLEVWGHPHRPLLLVEVTDPHRVLQPREVTLIQWRSTMRLEAAAQWLGATEVHARAARPHLANTGMQDFFDASSDPLLGRGLGVALGADAAVVRKTGIESSQQIARMTLHDVLPPRFTLWLTAAVTRDGQPLSAARRELDAAQQAPLESLRAEHAAWWEDWWGQSFLRIQSPDRLADWLCAAYHVHLYTLGCVNRGSVPCKWDGGPGLMREDERTWGLSEWVQEIRFTYLPLYSANRLEMVRGLTRFYSSMTPYLRAQTRQVWARDGLWVPETVTPWGHAEDLVLEAAENPEHFFLPWDPSVERYGRFNRFNGYVTFLFTAGLEVCHHYLLYYRYSGDEAFLRDEAYPILRDVCRFVSSLLVREEDGLFHLEPANALETWWLVRDPADTLAGIEAVFPEFIRLSEQYGTDASLRAACREILDHLPKPPLGHWDREGNIDPAAGTYAPAAAIGTLPGARNFEIPALYRVFPFGLSGIGTPDLAIARATFARRIYDITNSWSLDAVWAARLGLAEEAGRLLHEHATRYNRFRYGGWDSSNSAVFPGDLAVAPYIDGAGLSAFAVQEVLLQTYDGTIRLLPAVPENWSGIYQLRGERGFLVAVDFTAGTPQVVELHSLHGNRCRLQNPWGRMSVVRHAQEVVLRSAEPVLEFDTRADQRYLVEAADQPLDAFPVRPIDDQASQQPGLPGRAY